MIDPIIKEDLLYYVWKTKTIDMVDLCTTDGQPIEIVGFGYQNYDAGPDFSNAKIRIGDTLWVGNVEMHVYASDWERHAHDVDKSYDNVIIHVVYEYDKDVFTTNEHKIPCVEVKDRIPQELKSGYAKLIANNLWIPCENQIDNVAEHTVSFWLQRLVAERLTAKTEYLSSILSLTENNWEETFYIFLMRYMGAKVNMEPFESLAKNLQLSLIQKNKDELLKIEALLYGQAGMLQADFQDPYFITLKNEYNFLAQKYRLQHIPPVSWKFARMRPSGFPTVRIAQIAKLLYENTHLFSTIIDIDKTKELKALFRATPSTYWKSHYRFGTDSVEKEKPISDGFIDLIIINVVSPILFLYGKSIGNELYCERAILHLEATKAEKNKIVDSYKKLGIAIKSASDSQALLQLKKNYCNEKRCLSCSIGVKLLK